MGIISNGRGHQVLLLVKAPDSITYHLCKGYIYGVKFDIESVIANFVFYTNHGLFNSFPVSLVRIIKKHGAITDIVP